MNGHEKVDDGLNCSVCGESYQTRLGLERHLSRHRRAERSRESATGDN